MLAIAVMISRGENERPLGTIAAGRTASAIESMPQMPQPVGPAICRRRSLSEFGLGRRQPHPQLDAVVEFDDIERVDLVRRLHDAFAEAEADREIPQVLRRAHHHGVGAAIIGQRQRGLLRDQARAFAEAAVAPDLPIDCADRIVHPLTPRLPPARCGANDGPARHRPSASRTDRSTARSAPP